MQSIKKAYDSSVSSLQELLRGENVARRRVQEQHGVLLDHVEKLQTLVRIYLSICALYLLHALIFVYLCVIA